MIRNYMRRVFLINCFFLLILFLGFQQLLFADELLITNVNSVAEIYIDVNAKGKKISPLLFGVNYDWNRIPATEYSDFESAMRNIAHYTIIRFPGGWNAEHYDWINNDVPDWVKRPQIPGIDPKTIIFQSPKTSFTTPSIFALKRYGGEDKLIAEILRIIREYQSEVKMWEIGNEWWLQEGASKSSARREEMLKKYALLVRKLVPLIKKDFPDIKLYVTGDWLMPEQFEQMKKIIGENVWDKIHGVSVHIYCGKNDAERNCSLIKARLQKISQISGKKNIFVSEWAVAKQLTDNNVGMKHANEVILAIKEMAEAGVEAAAYWPPVKILPDIAFVSADYKKPKATGLLFGWMSVYYKGYTLETTGDIFSAASKDNNRITIFIPSYNVKNKKIRIHLKNACLTKVVSSKVLYSENPDGTGLPKVTNLPVNLVKNNNKQYIEFVLNPGISGRGEAWEIANITIEW